MITDQILIFSFTLFLISSMYLWIRLLDQEAEGCWKWMKPPPASKKPVNVLDPEERKLMKEAMDAARSSTLREQLLKGSAVQLIINFCK